MSNRFVWEPGDIEIQPAEGKKWRLGKDTPPLEAGETTDVAAVNARAAAQERRRGVARTEEEEDGSSARNSATATQDTGGVVEDDG